MKKSNFLFASILSILALTACGQKTKTIKSPSVKQNNITFKTGAEQTEVYLPLLKGKRIGMVVNPTSIIGKQTVVDSLVKRGVNIVKIFGPEHGFRGDASAGVSVDDAVDAKTGIKAISLYGKHSTPTKEDLSDVDIMIFDIQDVGVRFYTYINTLQHVMEACALYGKEVMILDRPNPNGFYVDGPVLDTLYASFIGKQPVPIVYGMTIGEYAKMLLGEKWIDWKYGRKTDDKISLGELLGFENERDSFKLTVIQCKNYTHKSRYILPVKTSPNLADMDAVYRYPSTCFFEGTVLSEGRGTSHPFQIFGHPKLPDTLYNFTPVANTASKEPKLKDQLCYGWNICNEPAVAAIQLKWLLQAYLLFPDKENFFLKPQKFNARPQDYFFNKLAGNSELMQQIKDGKTEEAICKSWQPGLDAFKKIRKKYLLYPDFETD